MEDDAKTSHVVSKIIQDGGYQLEHAKNGIEAVKKFRETKPDLVLMDISMPEIDGDEASIQISREFPDAKIVLMTAFGRDWVSEGVKIKGVLGTLYKPFRASSLNAILEKFC